MLYSLYAFPNVVVPLFGGMLIDTKGPRIALLLTAGLCVLGHFIFSIGGLKSMWFLMLAGRVVFGLGGEVLHAAQNTVISRWFKASELSVNDMLFRLSLEFVSAFLKWAAHLMLSFPHLLLESILKKNKVNII